MHAWLETMGWMLTCALVLAGVGAWVARALEGAETLHPVRTFWWGVLVVMPVAALWHLALPLDERLAMLLALGGLAGWLRHGRALARQALEEARAHPVATLSWLLLWVGLPYMSLQRVTCVDSALYYLVSVEWHRAYAYLPGLQATNPLSVMNTGYFLLVALVGTGPFAHEGHFVANAMLAWFGLPLAVAAVERLTRRWSPAAVCVALTGAPGIDSLHTDRMSCPSADIGVLWLGVAATLITFTSPRLRATLVFSLLTPVLKLSLVPLAVLVGAWSTWRLRAQLSRRVLATTAVLVAGAWLPLFAGQVVMSGYPLYPAPVLAFPVDWALPEPLVRRVSAVIRSYASHDGLVGPNTPASIISRLLLMNRAVLLPVVLLFGGLLTGLVFHARRARAWLPLLVVASGGWLLWFLLAPDPRFAGVVLWLGGAAGLCAALGLPRPPPAFVPDFASRLGVFVVVVGLLLGDVPFMVWPTTVPTARPERPQNTPEELITLSDGTRIVDCTPGRAKAGCFSLPCAAIYPDGLHLRVPGDLSRGFALPPDAGLPHLTME